MKYCGFIEEGSINKIKDNQKKEEGKEFEYGSARIDWFGNWSKRKDFSVNNNNYRSEVAGNDIWTFYRRQREVYFIFGCFLRERNLIKDYLWNNNTLKSCSYTNQCISALFQANYKFKGINSTLNSYIEKEDLLKIRDLVYNLFWFALNTFCKKEDFAMLPAPFVLL
jgi:hypothetical protein